MTLKPCPFCGSSNIDERTRTSEHDGEEVWQAYTECYDCGAQGPATAWYSGFAEDPHGRAIYHLRNMEGGWNTRHIPDVELATQAIRAELERQNVPMGPATDTFPHAVIVYHSPAVDLALLAEAALQAMRDEGND